ncbi:MAG: RNase adapter RapZ, partial [Candidatus Nanopelagicales bacterium]
MNAGTAPELLLITGLSGAGRSAAAKVLEDLDWYVVDNLPPSLIPTMADLGARAHGSVPRIAVVVDVRSRTFFAELADAMDTLRQRGMPPRVLFLEASQHSLVRRFENVRRLHPLQGDGRLVDGISRERQLLSDLRGSADLVIDTSDLNVHELRHKLEQAFADDHLPALHATVMSFGYKYGLPVDADLVVDCRFLPNPHWDPELRPKTGLDQAVSDYVLNQPDAKSFLDRLTEMLNVVTPGFLREGKRHVTLAIGCTGGKHRSVAMTEEVAK